jgi:arylsulfatase
MNKPNIVFFMLDQLSAKWVDAAAAGVCPIPNIQRLQSCGTTFTNTITSNPICCPARATLATGLTARGHGVLENGYQLDPALPTFMQALQSGGWYTGAFGKLHLQPHFRTLAPNYHPYGFDVVHNTEDGRGGEWLDWVEKTHPEHYESALATIWTLDIPEYSNYGPDKLNLRERIDKIRSNFKWETSEFPQNAPHGYTLPFPEEISQTNWITQHAVTFIQNTPPEQPLYAHISYVQPHAPCCPPSEYMHKVNINRIPLALPAEWVDDELSPKELKRREPFPPSLYNRQLYFADLVHLDKQLGRIIDILEETGRMANTFIILLADHGDLLSDHGLIGKAEKHYDACIRVPLIIAGPGLKENIKCDEIVQLEDICPTVLDMAGLGLPPMPVGPYLKEEQDVIAQLPGRSLIPFCCEKPPAKWRDAAYIESYNSINSTDPGQWARTVRTKQYRYTFYPQGNGEQLFDLLRDPDEQANLIGSPEHAGICEEMRNKLMELIILQDYPKTRRELFLLGTH